MASEIADTLRSIYSNENANSTDTLNNDCDFVLKYISIDSDPLHTKLACQASDKCCLRNATYTATFVDALSSLMFSNDRTIKISAADALRKICMLNSIDTNTKSYIHQKLNDLLIGNANDNLLCRALQEAIDKLNAKSKIANTSTSSANDIVTSSNTAAVAATTATTSSNVDSTTKPFPVSVQNMTEKQWNSIMRKMPTFYRATMTSYQSMCKYFQLTTEQLQDIIHYCDDSTHLETVGLHWNQKKITQDEFNAVNKSFVYIISKYKEFGYFQDEENPASTNNNSNVSGSDNSTFADTNNNINSNDSEKVEMTTNSSSLTIIKDVKSDSRVVTHTSYGQHSDNSQHSNTNESGGIGCDTTNTQNTDNNSPNNNNSNSMGNSGRNMEDLTEDPSPFMLVWGLPPNMTAIQLHAFLFYHKILYQTPLSSVSVLPVPGNGNRIKDKTAIDGNNNTSVKEYPEESLGIVEYSTDQYAYSSMVTLQNSKCSTLLLQNVIKFYNEKKRRISSFTPISDSNIPENYNSKLTIQYSMGLPNCSVYVNTIYPSITSNDITANFAPYVLYGEIERIDIPPIVVKNTHRGSNTSDRKNVTLGYAFVKLSNIRDAIHLVRQFHTDGLYIVNKDITEEISSNPYLKSRMRYAKRSISDLEGISGNANPSNTNAGNQSVATTDVAVDSFGQQTSSQYASIPDNTYNPSNSNGNAYGGNDRSNQSISSDVNGDLKYDEELVSYYSSGHDCRVLLLSLKYPNDDYRYAKNECLSCGENFLVNSYVDSEKNSPFASHEIFAFEFKDHPCARNAKSSIIRRLTLNRAKGFLVDINVYFDSKRRGDTNSKILFYALQSLIPQHKRQLLSKNTPFSGQNSNLQNNRGGENTLKRRFASDDKTVSSVPSMNDTSDNTLNEGFNINDSRGGHVDGDQGQNEHDGTSNLPQQQSQQEYFTQSQSHDVAMIDLIDTEVSSNSRNEEETYNDGNDGNDGNAGAQNAATKMDILAMMMQDEDEYVDYNPDDDNTDYASNTPHYLGNSGIANNNYSHSYHANNNGSENDDGAELSSGVGVNNSNNNNNDQSRSNISSRGQVENSSSSNWNSNASANSNSSHNQYVRGGRNNGPSNSRGYDRGSYNNNSNNNSKRSVNNDNYEDLNKNRNNFVSDNSVNNRYENDSRRSYGDDRGNSRFNGNFGSSNSGMDSRSYSNQGRGAVGGGSGTRRSRSRSNENRYQTGGNDNKRIKYSGASVGNSSDRPHNVPYDPYDRGSQDYQHQSSHSNRVVGNSNRRSRSRDGSLGRGRESVGSGSGRGKGRSGSPSLPQSTPSYDQHQGRSRDGPLSAQNYSHNPMTVGGGGGAGRSRDRGAPSSRYANNTNSTSISGNAGSSNYNSNSNNSNLAYDSKSNDNNHNNFRVRDVREDREWNSSNNSNSNGGGYSNLSSNYNAGKSSGNGSGPNLRNFDTSNASRLNANNNYERNRR